MKILITGGNGQIAYDLKRLAPDNVVLYAPAKEELDIIRFNSITANFENYQPDFVINTAAFTQVDRAEQEKDYAFAVNCKGAKNLAIACERFDVPLLHVSTDYVFDGKLNRPYVETDAPDPINTYGESKLWGEMEIQQYCKKYMILRVSAVYGIHGNNFVKTILRLAREKEVLRVVSDQVICPTPSKAIAETLLYMALHPHWGVFHFCGGEVVSWYDFAKTIINSASQFEKLRVQQIEAVRTSEYPTPAKRPLYSVLNCDKLNSVFHIQQPNWQTGLIDVIKSLYTT